MPQPSLDDEIQQLLALSRRLREVGRLDEAAELLTLALRLSPRDDAAKLAFSELNDARRQAASSGRPQRSVRDTLREELRRNAIDSAHFLGLAHLYAEKGLDEQALECLEVARAKDLAGPALHKLHGRLLLRRGEAEGAAAALDRALHLNPFDREIAEELGRAELEHRRFEPSLRATIHAFLLLHDADEEGGDRLKRRIRTLKRLLALDANELTPYFHERQEYLQTAFERLEWRRELFLEEGGLIRSSLAFAAPVRRRLGGRIDLAARLRRLREWSHFSDEQIFRLTLVVDEEVFEPGSVVFAHRSDGRDLYLVEAGEVSIQRTTSYGTYVLGAVIPGDLFGEASFISGHQRSGDAVAASPTHLFRFDGSLLDRLVADHPDLGVQLYWSFWHGLTRKLRSTNDQLRSFFDPGALPENFLRLRRAPQRPPEEARLASSDKIRLFREQGLSRRELMALATFSEERRYPEGATIFHEGDRGGELYIIAEGRVMISKMLGGGEEALAILGRGDFFGEMALIDGEPRSADARAHGGPLTVLALDGDAVQEVLAMDASAAFEFLQLLCRLMVNRLREIDEKVIGWRILAGEQTESVSA
jgi:CRP/FNR family transcriptional regulator, cyclic AMP receptor protein